MGTDAGRSSLLLRNMFGLPQRLIAAWSLLLVMGVLIAPRELLHRCEVPQEAHQDHNGGDTIAPICPVCDAAVPVALTAEDGLEIVPVAGYIRRHSDAIRTADAPWVLRCTDRGPPTLS
jgi:hypothetical protein